MTGLRIFLASLCLSMGFAEERVQEIVFSGSDGNGVVGEGQNEVQCAALLNRSSGFVKKIRQTYLGQPLNKKLMTQLKEDVLQFYEDQSQPFAIVSVSEDPRQEGTLLVKVKEAKLGQVRAVGNRYFSSPLLTGYIQTKPGESIVMQDILEDMAWINQNPFRKTNAVFVPGSKPGTADLELATIDRFPTHVYVGSDNTGMIPTQRNRIFFGADFGKTIIQDSQISYQFSCSPNWNRFFAHTASTRIPTPWRHTVVLFGGYAEVEPSLCEQSSKEKGKSWQVDGRYRIPWVNASSVMQTLILGYDFKETKDWVKTDGQKTFDAVADINQFMLGYELGYCAKNQRVSFQVEVYGNPSGITTKNKTSDIRKFIPRSNAAYVYGKAAHSFARKIPYGFWFTYDLQGQYASTNLLPSEQVVLTGYGAVRGFEERIVSVDTAVLGSVAIELPHFSPLKLIGALKEAEDDFFFHLFFDAGFGGTRWEIEGEHQWKSLGSAGPGARYRYRGFITARFDYGFQLWHSGFDRESESRYNFGVTISY